MKIIKNEKLIERNGKIGQWTSLAALGVLGLGMYISFAKPELFIYSVICLLVGFIMTQVGMYMGSRWGRSPRPDEQLDSGLNVPLFLPRLPSAGGTLWRVGHPAVSSTWEYLF